MNRRERRAAAKKSQLALNGAGSLAALCEAGLDHLRAERFPDAQLCCRQALTIDPSHADALHLMGLVSLQAGRPDHAMEWFVSAISQAPKAKYLSSLGMALERLGRLEEALMAFDRAVQLKPDDAQGH
jgi:tetratricopeptide (TPR) repeat protein